MSTVLLEPSVRTTCRRPITGRWQIDGHRTELTVRARALGLPVRGRFTGTTGVIDVADSITRSQVRVTVGSDSFETGWDAQDRVVAGTGFLDAHAHPTLSFAAHGLQPILESMVTADGDRPLWWLVGEVTARGVTRPVRLALGVVRQDGDCMEFSATGSIRRSEFGAVGKRGLISDLVEITVHGSARRQHDGG